jgi:hypothetical protein
MYFYLIIDIYSVMCIQAFATVLNSKVKVHYDLLNLLGSNWGQGDSFVKINRLSILAARLQYCHISSSLRTVHTPFCYHSCMRVWILVGVDYLANHVA